MRTQHTLMFACIMGALMAQSANAAPAQKAAQQVAQQSATALPTCNPWISANAYTGGMYTTHNSKTWRAKWWTQGETPGATGVVVWEARAATECTAGTGGGGGTTSGTVPTLAEAQAAEASKTSSTLFQNIKKSIRTLDTASVEAVLPGRSLNPANVKRVERLLSSAAWDNLFQVRDPSYTYTRFLQAMAKFPGACDDYTDGRNADAICRKTLATMFAHFAQETGAHDPNSKVPQWQQGLYFLREAGCSDTDTSCGYNAECDPNTWQGQTWPCGKNANGTYKKYYGRGAKQLSYNYNYGPFSDAMFGTVRTLLDKPELVADTWLNLASAVFFFVYPQPPKPSMLHVVDGTWQPNSVDLAANITPGFGASIHIINGGIECGLGYDKPQALNRISYYQNTAAYFGVPIDRTESLSCANMKPFAAGGAGAQLIYWDQDWAYDPSRPDGKSYACKLVGYQTPYNALKTGDYVQCVQKHFNVVLK